jgi:hypothetical protein
VNAIQPDPPARVGPAAGGIALTAPPVGGPVADGGVTRVREALWPVLVFHGATTYYYLP